MEHPAFVRCICARRAESRCVCGIARIARGSSTLMDPILGGTPRGIYVRSLGAGRVDPDTGRVTLIIAEGFLIEAGSLTWPIDESIIIANARDLLGSIDAVGNDLSFDHGSGNCLKADQQLPVIVGMPTMRLGLVRVVSP